uniref:Uncharacterized protein n=1 Tax=Micrurus lemniscatus lemniscatus TaxID=129467 RepID=A0A2D4I5Z3_MICLE
MGQEKAQLDPKEYPRELFSVLQFILGYYNHKMAHFFAVLGFDSVVHLVTWFVDSTRQSNKSWLAKKSSGILDQGGVFQYVTQEQKILDVTKLRQYKAVLYS